MAFVTDTDTALPYDLAADVPGFINLLGGMVHAQALYARRAGHC
jgi:hypothetical protein